jgi:hypothetical protein
VLDSIRQWLNRTSTGFRSRGTPPLSEPVNGVTAFHLWWQGIDGGEPLVEVSATLSVLRQPTSDRLYFWALQASFLSDSGANGAAHIGLQWNPRHPGFKAVNWGGYADISDVRSILDGTPSPLPSTPSDPNTRDYPWREGVPYRLRISPGSPSGWQGSITDLSTGETTVIRDLLAAGDRLGGFVVWAEVFAACNHSQTVVQWSDFEARTPSGDVRAPASVRLTFPTGGDCPNTDVVMSQMGLLQITNTVRTARDAAVLPVPGR